MNIEYMFYKTTDYDDFLYYIWPEIFIKKHLNRQVSYCFGLCSESFELADGSYGKKMFVHRFENHSTDMCEKNPILYLKSMDKDKHIHDIHTDIFPHSTSFFNFLIRNINLFFKENRRGVFVTMDNFHNVLLPQMSVRDLIDR